MAVVVGATGAMGAEFTGRLVARGYRVVAVARDGSALNALAEVHGPNIIPCVADVGDDSAEAAIRQSLDEQVKIAVFAAGLPVRGSADVICPAELAAAANIKVGGVVRLLRGVRDHLSTGSRFITIAGSLGIEPGPLDAAPGTVNAALLNLMRQLSVLYGAKGITTHTIAPGPIDTPRLRALVATQATETGTDPGEVWQRYVSRTSLGRLPALREIGWLLETLLSPEADVLHGAVLSADGGTRHGLQ
ncbi:short-chain dehydrogenase [Mycolicibacterium helvum]|uniref:Short-chain dehydrogenase n=1 Tax=Mycolicibacterium helvum TaxID=1534349 RepID=A0A7I7T1G6_9MYCO|nr:short-chain dehydrogenase [Mycolicibacterium helvum]